MTRRTTPGEVFIRWMIRRDMPCVLAIENACFEFPWDEDAFIRCLRQRNCIGMVAEIDSQIVGFMLYELHKSRLHLLDFAVSPDHRLQGVGTAMIAKLIGKLNPERRSRILVEVRETNLNAQMFFRAEGFRYIATLKDFYEDINEAAYLLQLKCQGPVKAERQRDGRNRISAFL